MHFIQAIFPKVPRGLFLFLLLHNTLSCVLADQIKVPFKENEIKAVLIYKFLNFVTLPPAAPARQKLGTNQAFISVGFLCDEESFGAFKIIEGRIAQKKEL